MKSAANYLNMLYLLLHMAILGQDQLLFLHDCFDQIRTLNGFKIVAYCFLARIPHCYKISGGGAEKRREQGSRQFSQSKPPWYVSLESPSPPPKSIYIKCFSVIWLAISLLSKDISVVSVLHLLRHQNMKPERDGNFTTAYMSHLCRLYP